jgi:hypothetical protein
MSGYSTSRDVTAARIEHRCDHCEQPILVGEPYRYLAFDCEGEFADAHVHHECHRFCLTYTCTDEGWYPLCQSDPSDEFELAEQILAEPPAADMIDRLPPKWREAVRQILDPPPA